MVRLFDPNWHYVGEVVDPPATGDVIVTLLGFLERQRATFAWKCSGLDERSLRLTMGNSPMSLGGMLKHLARFEDDMSIEWLRGEPQGPPWNTIDWAVDHDWDWRTAATETSELLYDRWQESVRRSRDRFIEAHQAKDPRPIGSPSLPYILINMIEEYARHNGHADLIREAVDGLVGHDPPT